MLDITFIKKAKVKASEKIAPYRKYFSALLLIGGFIVDTFTLNRIDQVFDNTILIVHLLIVAVVIVLLQKKKVGKLEKFFKGGARAVLLGLLMFSFGGLFSGFTIFYAKSAGLFSGWAFVVLLLFIMLSAEYYQKAYSRLAVRVGTFTLALYLYLIFAIPVVLGKMGPGIFLVSSLVTIVLVSLFIKILKRNSGGSFLQVGSLKNVASFVVGLVFILYFTNLVPPVPLSLQFSDSFYQVDRTGDGYVVSYESVPWYRFSGGRSKVMYRQPGQPVFVFSSVFAPVNLQTSIVHQWQRKVDGRWVTTDEITIPITGGRADGFRGFSFKQNHQPGSWRVRITTSSGQVIGSTSFKLLHQSTPGDLSSEVF